MCLGPDLFDALMELSSLTLSPEDFSAISTLAKEPQSSVSLVRASKALASRDRVWICKAVQKRWCAQMIGVRLLHASIQIKSE